MIRKKSKTTLILSLVFGLFLLGAVTALGSEEGCNLVLTKSVDKTEAEVGDVLTYTLHYKNIGNEECSGYDIIFKNSGALVKDYLNDNFLYEYVHTESVLYDTDLKGISYSSYAKSYSDYTQTVRTAHWLNWNANIISPGEEGTITFQVKILEPLECGNFEVANYFEVWSKENGWESSNKVYVSVNNECPQPYCGDNHLDSGEECDDGNNVNGDGCSSTCITEEIPYQNYCGDEIIYFPFEICDDGNDNGKVCTPEYGDTCSYCKSNCMPRTLRGPYCGDGNLDIGYEECDDGNSINSDGCNNECEIVEIPPQPVCGNHVLEAGEECDDGNNVNGDGCSSSCNIEQNPPAHYCGDNHLDSGEECDDGNNVNGDGCSSSCKTESDDDNEKDYTKLNHFVQYCDTNWKCTGWSECINGATTRTCVDTNNCDIEYNKPYEQTGCDILSNAYVENDKNSKATWILAGIIIFVILLVILINLL